MWLLRAYAKARFLSLLVHCRKDDRECELPKLGGSYVSLDKGLTGLFVVEGRVGGVNPYGSQRPGLRGLGTVPVREKRDGSAPGYRMKRGYSDDY